MPKMQPWNRGGNGSGPLHPCEGIELHVGQCCGAVRDFGHDLLDVSNGDWLLEGVT